MSVTNDPQFRWGGSSEFVWWLNDPALSATRKISTIDNRVASKRLASESAGGAWEVLNLHSYFDVPLTVKHLDENSTHDLHAFLSWTNAGNPFQFTFDSRFDGAIGNVIVDADPSSNRIITDYGFPLGLVFEAIIYNHLGQYDKIAVMSEAPGDSAVLNFMEGSRLTNSYTADNAIVKYAYYYQAAKATSSMGAFTLRPGKVLYNWSFQFREPMDVMVLA